MFVGSVISWMKSIYRKGYLDITQQKISLFTKFFKIFQFCSYQKISIVGHLNCHSKSPSYCVTALGSPLRLVFSLHGSIWVGVGYTSAITRYSYIKQGRPSPLLGSKNKYYHLLSSLIYLK